MSTPRPPRALAWLLRRLTPRDAAAAALGDILEVLENRAAAGRAPRWPALWMRGQVALAIWSALRGAAPKLARAWGHTFRDALRGARRRPAQSIFIVLVLAIGMSAATVTFSVVDATVLRPLPFEESDRIVRIYARTPAGATGLSPDAFWAIHDHLKGADGLAPASTYGNEEMTVLYTTASLFRVLRVRPHIGDIWTAADEGSGAKVALITHAFWHRQFGGDPGAVGRTVRSGPNDYRVIGVLGPGVTFPSFLNRAADVWIPRRPARAEVPGRAGNRHAPLARLAPGVSIEQLAAEIESTLAPLAASNPSAYGGARIEIVRWKDTLTETVRPWMLLALGSVGLVLLIACANAANIMLTRSWERSRELAVRASLGASRRQLGATLILESLALAIAAVLAALLFATWGIKAAKAALPIQPFGWDAIALDARVMTACVLAAIATGLVCGVVPALQASRASVLTLIKDGGATATARRRGWRSVFLTAQVASVAALLVVATLFIGSFARVMTADLGLDRSNLIGAQTIIGNGPRVPEFVDRLRAIPGVSGVAAIGGSSPPLVGYAFGGAYRDTKIYRPDASSDAPVVDVRTYGVGASYFDVVGTRFLQGSMWPAQRAGETPLVPAVIDEPTARRLFASEPPVGRLLRARDSDRVYTVTGVVPYLLSAGPEGTRQSTIYFPIEAMGRDWVGFFIRTSVPPGPVALDVRETLQAMMPPGRRAEVNIMDDAFGRLTSLRRFNGVLMSLFALLAVAIGGAGVYAAMASAVAQRTREIGVRMALGASTRAIRQSVLAESGRFLALGLAIGLPIGWAMSRSLVPAQPAGLMGSLFFQVAPGDLSIHLIVAAVLVLAGLVAAAVPARRASRIDPVITLRSL